MDRKSLTAQKNIEFNNYLFELPPNRLIVYYERPATTSKLFSLEASTSD